MSIEPAITLEQLTPTQRELAEIIGIDNYLKLVKRYGGSGGIYIPKYSELIRPSRDMEIKDKFNGYNYAQLADEYDLSVRTIYKIVSDMINQRQNAPLENQISFF